MRRSQARIVLAVGAVVLAVVLVAMFASDRPTNRTLTITGADAGDVRQLCVSARVIEGDEEIELGGAFVGAPQWLEADDPTTARLRPSAGIAPMGVHVTFVDGDGRVISDHDGGSRTVTAAGPWSGALLASPDDALTGPTRITADDGC